MPLKVCVITSSRADWGLLQPVAALMKTDADFDLKIIVTGQHLVAAAGHSADDIVGEGFTIDERVDMGMRDDSALGVTTALAKAVEGIGRAIHRLKPDIIMLLGDRYEILGAATAATIARVPIAHLCGGDVTEGAVDDAFRHAITKMSHLHFVTTSEAERRVQQLGEDPAHVFMVGSTGLDRIRTAKLLGRDAFFESIGLQPRTKNILSTFHPETLEPKTREHAREMLEAFDLLGPDTGILFSGTNSDVEGLAIGQDIALFVKTHPNAVLVQNLGSVRYLSALKHMDAIVGNSSSGLYEAPSFQIPTVNIGDRQKGRPRAASVIDTRADRQTILAALRQAFTLNCTNIANPYGDGYSAPRVMQTLKAQGDLQPLLKKQFLDARAS